MEIYVSFDTLLNGNVVCKIDSTDFILNDTTTCVSNFISQTFLDLAIADTQAKDKIKNATLLAGKKVKRYTVLL